MDSSVLQKYELVKTDGVLRGVFDFDKFLETTGMDQVLLGFGANENTSRYDFRVVDYAIETMAKHVGKELDEDRLVNGGAHLWADMLFDICFEKGFVPYLLNDFRQSFNNTNISQTSDIRKQVQDLLEQVDVRKELFNKAGAIQVDAVEQISQSYFSFGESLYVQTAEFDVGKFKTKVTPIIIATFKPYFYYKYLYLNHTECGANDQRCLRIYMLACMVYIYYFIMSIFLIVFATHEKTQAFKAATNQNDISINEARRKLVHMMDNTLVILSDDTMRENGEKTDVRDFYNAVKQMSLNNVKTSNHVVKMKNDITVLQNNLGNYNAMESVTARQYYNIKVWFYVSLVFWLGMIAYMVGLTLLRSYLLADVMSAISIVACILVAVFVARR